MPPGAQILGERSVVIAVELLPCRQGQALREERVNERLLRELVKAGGQLGPGLEAQPRGRRGDGGGQREPRGGEPGVEVLEERASRMCLGLGGRVRRLALGHSRSR